MPLASTFFLLRREHFSGLDVAMEAGDLAVNGGEILEEFFETFNFRQYLRSTFRSSSSYLTIRVRARFAFDSLLALMAIPRCVDALADSVRFFEEFW